MGQFSWMYSDTNNTKALNEGKSAYVACPDGTYIYEECYEGYGIFGGHDIFDLVADWNKDHISVENIIKPIRKNYGTGEMSEQFFLNALDNYKMRCNRITDFITNAPDSYMVKQYGKDWKRSIGIDIACYDEQNAALKYPIKICKNNTLRYDFQPSSDSDPNQGWGSDED